MFGMVDRERSPVTRALTVIHGRSRGYDMSVEELNVVFQCIRQRRIKARLAMRRFAPEHSVVVDYPFLDMPFVLTYGRVPMAAAAA